ncbi:3'-5' exonuclease [Salinimicrobium xinjiangense]|uniref:3'-5' exonuclease n=1 Tax=Salinimicrobium xinjiangense TaxID=438596 RepID=UPI0003F4D71F|nr:3'-5' exonuclease [Salinimicrobium xinjiangense]
MAWMIKYDKLDDDQKDFVDNEINTRGNIWIKGFAGSGKSVMLIHALRKKMNSNPEAKVCVVVYTHSLIDMFKTGMAELGMPLIPVMTYHQFKKRHENYDYIFCDEVQDLPADVLAQMKRRSQHVYVAGDSNQSIYEDTVTTTEIGNIINARPFVLTRIYRLTRSIMNAVSNLLPNMDIFGSHRDMTKKDVSVRLGKGYDENEEVEYVWEQSSKATSEGYSAAVLLPKHDYIIDFANRLLTQNGKSTWALQENNYGKPDYNSLNTHFRKQGLKIEYVGNTYGSFQNAERNRNTILMTYHSAKGMDFDNVFLPFLSDDTSISKRGEETLFMVAITRSKMNLFITYSGYLHHLVSKFESTCQRINLKSSNQYENTDVDFDF